MPKETILCTCPVCGSMVEPDRFNEEHKFKVVKRVMGGKLKRTDAEKLLMKGEKGKRGSAAGNIRYTPQGDMAADMYRPMIENAIRRAQSNLREEAKS